MIADLSLLEGTQPDAGEETPPEEGEVVLEDVTMRELSFEDTVLNLMSGEVILLTTYEGQREKDTLVRLRQTKNGAVTQVSKPTTTMEGFVGGNKYWSLYDISLNTLSMYPTFAYDSTRYGLDYKFEPKSVVKHTSEHGDKDIAIVARIFKDEEGNFLYTLSGEGDKLFREEELDYFYKK